MRWRGIVLVVLIHAGCGGRTVPPAEPPAAPSLAPSGDLRVLLLWEAEADLDLYLTQPDGETVYFGNNPSRAGARLDNDVKCGHPARARSEMVRLPDPRPGRYRIGVDFIDGCRSGAAPVGFRVVALLGGAQRSATGVLAPERFEPRALDFEVREVASGLQLTEVGR